MEITATDSEAVTEVLENAKTLLADGSSVGSDKHSGGPIRFSLRRTDCRAGGRRYLSLEPPHPFSVLEPPHPFSVTESFSLSALPAPSLSSTVSFAFAFLPFFSALAIFLASLPFFGFSFRVFCSPEATDLD